MMEIVLDFNAKEGQLHAVIARDDAPDKRIPLQVTHFTPCAQFPVLAADPTGYIPEVILDQLMLEYTRKENVRWHEHFKARREDQRRNPQEIRKNDVSFRREAMEREGREAVRYEEQRNG